MKKMMLLAGLVAICVAARVLPHSANFAPVAAAALFAGMFCRSFYAALAVPLAAMLIGDSIIGFYDWKLMAAVYFGLAVPPLIAARFLLKGQYGIPRVVVSSLCSSLAFFVVSNAAVWAFSSFYDHNLAGFGACFAAAVPFFRNTATGDLFWSGVFFGSYAAFKVAACSWRQPELGKELAQAI
jgi:hypothetical protein